MAKAAFAPPQAPPLVAAQWFEETTATLPDGFRELLGKYSNIPDESMEDHVVQVRDKAWAIHRYPCLGQFRFVELSLSRRGELYDRLLDILKNKGGMFLDVGCCLGQDVRKLILDGAPRSAVAGAELNADFIELGYEMFQDRENGETRFYAANILDPVDTSSPSSSASPSSPLSSLVGKLSVVQLGMILHLFTWDEQITAFENSIKLLKGGKEGVSIIGQATGNLDATAFSLMGDGGDEGNGGGAWRRHTFKHSVETFERLIEEVSTRTGTRWKVKATLDEGLSVYDGKRKWDDPRTRRLLFEMERA